MKRIETIILSLAVLFASASATASANATCTAKATTSALADDKAIDFSQLPAAAQSFIQSDFSTSEISFITKDTELLDTTYDVHFTDGTKVEFNSKGEWKEISCKKSEINLKYVPKQILSTVGSKWPKAEIRKIERYKQGYEIELSNRLELKFDKKFRLLEIDD